MNNPIHLDQLMFGSQKITPQFSGVTPLHLRCPSALGQQLGEYVWRLIRLLHLHKNLTGE